MLPALTIARAVWFFGDLAADIIKATRRDSDGGRAITDAEFDAMVEKRKPKILDKINNPKPRRKAKK